MEYGYVVAAGIAAVPASISAWAGLRNGRKMKTNHGKNIGQHIEGLVEGQAQLAASQAKFDVGQAQMREWAIQHQESDNDVRVALGLPRSMLPFPVASTEHEGGAE